MRKIKSIFALGIIFSISISLMPQSDVSANLAKKMMGKKSEAASLVPQYRLFHPWTTEHIYTLSGDERNELMKAGWRYEGVNCMLPVSSDTPIYRLCNIESGEHHYTSDSNERDTLAKNGWRDEGIGWYSGGNIPIYRLYNPKSAGLGSHHYSSDTNEKNTLTESGWKDEGIGWMGSSAENYEDSFPLPPRMNANPDPNGLPYSNPDIASNLTAAIPSTGIEPPPAARAFVERTYNYILENLDGYTGSGINYLREWESDPNSPFNITLIYNSNIPNIEWSSTFEKGDLKASFSGREIGDWTVTFKGVTVASGRDMERTFVDRVKNIEKLCENLDGFLKDGTLPKSEYEPSEAGKSRVEYAYNAILNETEGWTGTGISYLKCLYEDEYVNQINWCACFSKGDITVAILLAINHFYDYKEDVVSIRAVIIRAGKIINSDSYLLDEFIHEMNMLDMIYLK